MMQANDILGLNCDVFLKSYLAWCRQKNSASLVSFSGVGIENLGSLRGNHKLELG